MLSSFACVILRSIGLPYLFITAFHIVLVLDMICNKFKYIDLSWLQVKFVLFGILYIFVCVCVLVFVNKSS